MREGSRDGPWWVRLPLSSASSTEGSAMTALATILDALEASARGAGAAETTFRREAAERIKTLERERSHAFRRVNLLRRIVEAVACAESEEMAVAGSQAILRAKLGWSDDSEARSAIL